MDPYTIAGLPLHPLLVHAVVILAPLTGLAVILHALWPVAARRLGVVTPIAGLIVLILVPITINAGEALEKLVPKSTQLEHHIDLGDTLLPWAIALFVITLAVWLWTRYFNKPAAARLGRAGSLAVDIVLKAAAVVIGVGIIVDVVLIGEAGARAVWGGTVS